MKKLSLFVLALLSLTAHAQMTVRDFDNLPFNMTRVSVKKSEDVYYLEIYRSIFVDHKEKTWSSLTEYTLIPITMELNVWGLDKSHAMFLSMDNDFATGDLKKFEGKKIRDLFATFTVKGMRLGLGFGVGAFQGKNQHGVKFSDWAIAHLRSGMLFGFTVAAYTLNLRPSDTSAFIERTVYNSIDRTKDTEADMVPIEEFLDRKL